MPSAQKTLLLLQLLGDCGGVEDGVVILQNRDVGAEDIMCMTAIGATVGPAVLVLQIREEAKLVCIERGRRTLPSTPPDTIRVVG